MLKELAESSAVSCVVAATVAGADVLERGEKVKDLRERRGG